MVMLDLWYKDLRQNMSDYKRKRLERTEADYDGNKNNRKNG